MPLDAQTSGTPSMSVVLTVMNDGEKKWFYIYLIRIIQILFVQIGSDKGYSDTACSLEKSQGW